MQCHVRATFTLSSCHHPSTSRRRKRKKEKKKRKEKKEQKRKQKEKEKKGSIELGTCAGKAKEGIMADAGHRCSSINVASETYRGHGMARRQPLGLSHAVSKTAFSRILRRVRSKAYAVQLSLFHPIKWVL